MGNASNLRRNPTWSTILDEMEKEGQIGFGFPIICARHPEQVKKITEPGQLPKIAPLGMGRNYAINALLTPLQVAAYFNASSSFPADIIADLQ
jgi:hypothetical protein